MNNTCLLYTSIAMLNEFIEKILVHERDRKGSIQTTLFLSM